MPIKAAPVIAQKHELASVDSSGETWVYVRPASGRSRLMRAEFVKDRHYTDIGIMTQVNLVELQNLEIWLTCGNEEGEIGHIVVELPDGKERIFFEKRRDAYTEQEFTEELDLLYRMVPAAVAAWHAGVKKYNPGWVHPF